MRIHCGPDGSVYLINYEEIARFDADGKKIYGVKLVSDAADFRYRPIGADVAGNAYVLREEKLVRLSAAGAQRIVLESKRDGLPQLRMSIAVGPDGSFWLFGKNGLAWKFDARGGLLFASEKEPKPKKPTSADIWSRITEANRERAYAESLEQQRSVYEREDAEFRVRRRHGLILVGVIVVVVVAFVGSIVWLTVR